MKEGPYEKLPEGVLDKLREKNPVTVEGRRRHKHHQFLTKDIGNPHLEKQVVAVTTLMRAASCSPTGPRRTVATEASPSGFANLF